MKNEVFYNKLVRDRLPQIIKEDDKSHFPIFRYLTDDEYKSELVRKLQEEVHDYMADRSMDQLADILEVIHAIVEADKKTYDVLEKKRKDKKDKRGGFSRRVFLEKVKMETDLLGISEKEQDRIAQETNILKKHFPKLNIQKNASVMYSDKIVSGTHRFSEDDDIFELLKQNDPNSMVTIYKMNNVRPSSPTSEGGLSIVVDLGRKVSISAVGKGFDDCETSDRIPHERYEIDWKALKRFNSDNMKEHRNFLIDDKEYKESVSERKRYLRTLGHDTKETDKVFGNKYEAIEKRTWANVYTQFLSKLTTIEEELRGVGNTKLAISGRIERGTFVPHLITMEKRLTKLQHRQVCQRHLLNIR